MVLTAAFALETCLKLVGMGIQIYFRSWWNTFDLLLVIVTGVPYFIPAVQGMDWIRMLRLLRGLHLMRYVKGIGVIIQVGSSSQLKPLLCESAHMFAQSLVRRVAHNRALFFP